MALLRADEVRVEEKRLVAAIEQRTLQEVGHFERFEANVRAAYAEPGIGLPCGHVSGLPSTRSMAASTASLITCSHLPASWCASAHDRPS